MDYFSVIILIIVTFVFVSEILCFKSFADFSSNITARDGLKARICSSISLTLLKAVKALTGILYFFPSLQAG